MMRKLPVRGFENVVEARDRATQYHAFIAVHSTARGPAFGGTRLLPYGDRRSALRDALKLARAMTWKTACASLPAGGGKSVVMEPRGRFDRAALLVSHAAAIEELGGTYITAVDSGTTTADMEALSCSTRFVTSLETAPVAPAHFTAMGVLRAMQAAVRHMGHESLADLHVAIQGCGAVGYELAVLLRQEGARLSVADTNKQRARSLADACGATVVEPSRILSMAADILAPCALGGVLDENVVSHLNAPIVAGAANNQITRHGIAGLMMRRGICVIPDFVASAGGVIAGVGEYNRTPAAERHAGVASIFDFTLRILARSAAKGVTPYGVARSIARQRLIPGVVPLSTEIHEI